MWCLQRLVNGTIGRAGQLALLYSLFTMYTVMIIKYISKEGNLEQFETLNDKNWESKFSKIGNVWFEKRNTVPVVEKKAKKEVVVESEIVVQEEEKIDEIEQEIDEELAGEWKVLEREKSKEGMGLLKGEGLKKEQRLKKALLLTN